MSHTLAHFRKLTMYYTLARAHTHTHTPMGAARSNAMRWEHCGVGISSMW